MALKEKREINCSLSVRPVYLLVPTFEGSGYLRLRTTRLVASNVCAEPASPPPSDTRVGDEALRTRAGILFFFTVIFDVSPLLT